MALKRISIPREKKAYNSLTGGQPLKRIPLFTAFLALSVSVVFGSLHETESELQSNLMELGFRVFKEPADAPDFELENLAGETISLSSYRGKLVFLNFWATWCGPCRSEMPSMQVLYDSLGNDSFEIVAIDLQESRKAVQAFVDEFEFTFPVLLDSSGRVGSQYGARSIPTTYLIDTEGRAIGFFIGSRSWEGPEIKNYFETLLEKNSVEIYDGRSAVIW
jgi:peroxiredoxin